jgi:hypothetical protein
MAATLLLVAIALGVAGALISAASRCAPYRAWLDLPFDGPADRETENVMTTRPSAGGRASPGQRSAA